MFRYIEHWNNAFILVPFSQLPFPVVILVCWVTLSSWSLSNAPIKLVSKSNTFPSGITTSRKAQGEGEVLSHVSCTLVCEVELSLRWGAMSVILKHGVHAHPLGAQSNLGEIVLSEVKFIPNASERVIQLHTAPYPWLCANHCPTLMM